MSISLPGGSSFAQSYDNMPVITQDDKTMAMPAYLLGIVTMPVSILLGLVFSILAGLAANRGEWHDIPVLGKIARQQTG